MDKITPSFVTLPNRGTIRVGGEDAAKFLQGLITNDIAKLDTEPLLYAALLSAQGKFLHDFFIRKNEGEYLIECEGGARTADLLRRLTIYKLRSKVTLISNDTVPVYVIFEDGGLRDPRNPSMGYRSFTKPELPEVAYEVYDDLRIRLTLADGSKDAEIEKSTLEELNMAQTAVSFTKGCYVGQELTARMEHRGLAKRHLQALGFAETPVSGAFVEIDGKEIGTIRSVCGKIALALIRDDALPTLRTHDDQSFVYLLGR
jgi:folate-binding protein YgfZ